MLQPPAGQSFHLPRINRIKSNQIHPEMDLHNTLQVSPMTILTMVTQDSSLLWSVVPANVSWLGLKCGADVFVSPRAERLTLQLQRRLAEVSVPNHRCCFPNRPTHSPLLSFAASEKEGWHPVDATRGETKTQDNLLLTALLNTNVDKYWFWPNTTESDPLTQVLAWVLFTFECSTTYDHQSRPYLACRFSLLWLTGKRTRAWKKKTCQRAERPASRPGTLQATDTYWLASATIPLTPLGPYLYSSGIAAELNAI